jgi:hypothetical protein
VPTSTSNLETLTSLALNTNSLDYTDEDGNTTNIDLSAYLDNTDEQAISLSGNTLAITGNAGTVDLSPYLDNTDSQTLSLSGNNLTISSGNTQDLSSLTLD